MAARHSPARPRTGSRACTSPDAESSRLKLLCGQAQFEVAHEQRPFIVFAGGGSAAARGTIFEVAPTLTKSMKSAICTGESGTKPEQSRARVQAHLL
jgi:ferric-dicitrate binding protein FerR (iron transport regulator)